MKRILFLLVAVLIVAPELSFGMATEVTRTWYIPEEFKNLDIIEWTLTGVDAATTGAWEPLTLTYNTGYLAEVAVHSSSEDFDLAISTRNGSSDTIYEIYSYTGINKDYTDPVDPPQFFRNATEALGTTANRFNMSSYPYLYVRLKNDDAVNATGTWRLRLMILRK